MLAIESGLSALTEEDVVRINPNLPNSAERISLIDPHVVIIELNGKNNEQVLENLSQSIPLIVLDEARRTFMVLPGKLVPKNEINELAYVVEKIIRHKISYKERI
jgi:hypothetical protein